MNWWHFGLICAGGGLGSEALLAYKRWIPRSSNPKLARLGWDIILTVLIVPPLLGIALVAGVSWLPDQWQWAVANFISAN